MKESWEQECRRKGLIPNGFGGYSTKTELRDFIKSLDKRGKAEQKEIKKRRDIAVKALGLLGQ